MSMCFVMQPFDGDVYDKRYETVFAPAIQEAGLEPYRVDRDPSASVPIDDIERGIRDSQLCFAEITTDNPNVWFELGYAIAASKEVVLLCSEDRKSHFPFDVQHRSIIKYRCGAPQDFDDLREKIKQRIVALLQKEQEIARVSSISPVKDTEGLSQHEIIALVTVMENQFVTDSCVAASRIRNDMNKLGFTNIGVSLALRSLTYKDMVKSFDAEDEDGHSYLAFRVLSKGEDWLMANQERLVLRHELPPGYDSAPF